MKYAITADLHLRADNSDRLAYCDALCTLVQSQDIGNLIIAGDLFDQGYSGYKALDAILARHSRLQVTVLPGNHDPDLAQGQFSSINVRVVTRPEVLAGDKGETGLVLLPYREGCTMGEALTEAELETKKTGAWVLVSHGDFGTTARDLNGNESGYFPLTRRDITRYAFKRVILGHIHKPSSLDAEVLVPGSPWPIDSSERGPRRVLVLETPGRLRHLPWARVFTLLAGLDHPSPPRRKRTCPDQRGARSQFSSLGTQSGRRRADGPGSCACQRAGLHLPTK